jgi:hypothetical protein
LQLKKLVKILVFYLKMTAKATQNTTAMECRKELSELIKRKAEISVNELNLKRKQTNFSSSFF